jgi:hypothetical protein
MRVHVPFAAAAVLVGLAVVPASAMQTIHTPDSNTLTTTNQPPDGLFDPNMPTQWQKKTDSTDGALDTGKFHFFVNGNNSNQTRTPSTYGGALVPGSEFNQSLPGVNPDPFAPH